jgi:tetratricopeptide (TPR) repeat protein
MMADSRNLSSTQCCHRTLSQGRPEEDLIVRRNGLIELLGEFVRRIEESGDPSLAAAPGVQALAADLSRCLDEEHSPDIPARHLLGWLRWYQAAALPSDQRQPMVDAAMDVLSPAAIAIGLLEFPEPLLPALADQAAPRLTALLQHAAASADSRLLTDAVVSWTHLVNATPEGHPHRAERMSILCGGLLTRYQRTHDPADLDSGLAAGRSAVERGAGDPGLGMFLSNLGAALKLRYERTRDAADLDEAIVVARRAVATAADQYGRSAALTNLSGMLYTRFRQDGKPDDVTEAAGTARLAVAAASADDPEQAAMLHNLATALHDGFKITGSPADLDEALDAARLAVRAGEGRPDADMMLSNLGNALRSRFDLIGSAADLDEAIVVLRRLVAVTPAGHDSRTARLLELVSCLAARFDRVGDITDLDELVAASREATGDDPDSPALLVSLSTGLLSRYAKAGATADLDEAMATARSAVTSPESRDHDQQVIAIDQIERVLQARLRLSPDPSVLDELVAVHRSIADATRDGDAGQSERLSRLGHTLLTRFHDRKAAADLDEAVATLRRALATAAPGTERMYCLMDLCAALHSRFANAGHRADLNEAAGIARLDPAPPQLQPPPGLLLSLAVVLDARALTTGFVDDLDAAIRLVRRAAAATSAGHQPPPGRARGYVAARVEGIWSNLETDDEPGRTEVQRLLGTYLKQRFDLTNVLADADAWVQARRETVAMSAGGERARSLAALSLALKARFNRTGEQAYLDEALITIRDAVSTDPGNAAYLVSLSDALKMRFLLLQAETDLDDAVALGRRAALAPDANQNRSHAFANLCHVLKTRFELHLDSADIDEAVSFGRQALEAGQNDPDRAKWLVTLAEALESRIRRTGRTDPRRETDREEALRVTSELVRSPLAPPLLRVHGAKIGAYLAAEAAAPGAEDLTQAADLLETAVHLLPKIAPRRMRRDEQRGALESAAGLAGDAASLALAEETRPPARRAERALSLLEAGRAVLLGQLLDTRGELTGLLRASPDLAARFIALRDLLDRDADPAPSRGEGRIGTATELEATLREIRSLDGFASFALPPAASELLDAADQGPVVTFSVAHRGDALLLTAGEITALPLPAVSAATVIDQVNAFHVALRDAHDPAADRVAAQAALLDVLKWLWDNVTGPVLDALGYSGAPAESAPWPRVWWAPGGYLSLLPLHAAGHHDDTSSGKSVMDRVVSSYTPTIRTLRHARQRLAATTSTANRSLIVAMPATPGQRDLLNVPAEADLLAGILPGPRTLTEPDRDQVLAALPGHDVAHFACHGSYDPDTPTASRLLLRGAERYPLTVSDISAVNLDSARLAFLSACHTAVNSAGRLLDEAMHLAGAMQAAGFPQVIGTLCELDDEVAIEITEDFYAGLRNQDTGTLDLTRAAWSLHHAIRAQRLRYPGTPSLWASHLHFGA